MSDIVDPEQLKWLVIRDTLIGHNYKKQDLHKAYILAQKCTWPEALWLVDICKRNDGMPDTPEDAKTMFLKEEGDARAMGIATTILQPFDWALIRRASEMGDAFSQAYMCSRCLAIDRFDWAQRSAIQDEPYGLIWLGVCYQDGYGYGNSIDITSDIKYCYKRASELGDIISYYKYGTMFTNDQLEHFLALATYAEASRDIKPFCKSMSRLIKTYHNDPTSLNSLIFQIGKLLIRHLDKESLMLFGISCKRFKDSDDESDDDGDKYDNKCKKFMIWIRDACFALTAFNTWRQKTGKAVDAWTIIATRFRFPKDIRRLIGEIIWESRSQGLYDTTNFNKDIK